jgi:hypothetical protein
MLATPAWLVGLNARSAKLQKAAPPPGYLLPRDFQLPRDLIIPLSARGEEHHKTPLAQTLRSKGAFDRLGQPVAVLVSQMHGRSNSHGS